MNSTNPKDQPQYLGIRTAAARLHVHPETLRRWDNAGRIRAFRTPGGYRRFLVADLDAILEAAQEAVA